MLYFCSAVFKNLLAYDMGNHPLFSHCSNVAPRPLRLASHLTRVSFSLTKCFCSVISDILFFMLFSASVCSFDHWILLLLMFFLVVV